jgi:23S rRNA (cytosine1962-C5)-methyltransferase
MMARMERNPPGDVRLVDAGAGRRLERFGARLVDRPASAAGSQRRDAATWPAADLRFLAGRGWSGPADPTEPWMASVAGLTLELRATSSGGVGLYPEHAAYLDWLRTQVRARSGEGRDAPSTVLNLFAHTGLATLACAAAGAAVTHVDAARSSVAWARRNAEHNGLADRPVRWLVDDAQQLVDREARRGRRYDGFVIDPPTFGRAVGGRFAMRGDLPRLLDSCAALAADDAFVVLSAHSTGLDPTELAEAVARSFARSPSELAVRRLALHAESGATLDLGWAVLAG